jgi:hypothetical protein
VTLVDLDILLVTRYEFRAGSDIMCTAACKRLLVQGCNDVHISGDFNKLVHASPYTWITMLQFNTTEVQEYECLLAAIAVPECSLWTFITENICTSFNSATKVYINVLNTDLCLVIYVIY